jgi:hypothetical protein
MPGPKGKNLPIEAFEGENLITQNAMVGPLLPTDYGLGILQGGGARIYLHLLQKEDVSIQNQVTFEGATDDNGDPLRVSDSRQIGPRRISLDVLLIPELGRTNTGRPIDVWMALQAFAINATDTFEYVSPGYKTVFKGLIIEGLETSIPLAHGNAIRANISLIEHLRTESGEEKGGPEQGGERSGLVATPESISKGVSLDDLLHSSLPPEKIVVRGPRPAWLPGLAHLGEALVNTFFKIFPFLEPKREFPTPIVQSGTLADLLGEPPRGTLPQSDIPLLGKLTLSELKEKSELRGIHLPHFEEAPFAPGIPESRIPESRPSGQVKESTVLLAKVIAQKILDRLDQHATPSGEGNVPLNRKRALLSMLTEQPSADIFMEYLKIKKGSLPWQIWRQRLGGETFQFEIFWNTRQFAALSMRWLIGNDQIIPLIEGRKLVLNSNVLEPVSWHPVIRALEMEILPIVTVQGLRVDLTESTLGEEIQILAKGKIRPISRKALRDAKLRVLSGLPLPGVR